MKDESYTLKDGSNTLKDESEISGLLRKTKHFLK